MYLDSESIFINLEKRDNGVICAGEEIKYGLNLVRMETEVATHKSKLILRKKPEH